MFHLALEHGLSGWVSNSNDGVVIEAEGPPSSLRAFLHRLRTEAPPHSAIESLETVHLDPAGYEDFVIRPSRDAGLKTALVLPDIATCESCRRELFDETDRRWHHPFINCTHCDPRFSIIEALPYDRGHTTMKQFEMCPACQAEYGDPANRRFHAQPNACPSCGPHLELWQRSGAPTARDYQAVLGAVAELQRGAVVAVKGVGGFHLLVAARDTDAVRRLRRLKRREERPLALMVPTVEIARVLCEILPLEASLLQSSEAPIVLMRRNPGLNRSSSGVAEIADEVAPGNPYLGLMLPYSPVHHLLMAEFGLPVVATSGNVSHEPICIDEHEALNRLGDVADLFLIHDRPILRPVDDSVVQVVLGREMLLRRARGFAPLPIPFKRAQEPILAVGAHLKNTVALAAHGQIFLSQHIGDLDSVASVVAFKRAIRDMEHLFDTKPELVAADTHPDYPSTQHALDRDIQTLRVQHHYAHILACMAENKLAGTALGVSWDGTGYGTDSTVWGGEFLLISETSFERVGHLRTFRLPGGEKAVEEPRRCALGVLHELAGSQFKTMQDLAPVQAFSPEELLTIEQALAAHVNAPLTSSAGRLFDAVASLTGLRQKSRFEGQGAMDLEFAVDMNESDAKYPIHIAPDSYRQHVPTGASRDQPVTSPPLGEPAGTVILDWAAMVHAIISDLRREVPAWEISAKFHNTLAAGIIAVAEHFQEHRVVLSGGCFQNRYLLEHTVTSLRAAGFTPYWHQRVPTNDGGIALGQIVASTRRHHREKRKCV